MSYLFDEFTQLCLKYWKNSLEDLFNLMIDKKNDEEAQFMADNFVLFLNIGEAARCSEIEIKNELMK